MRRPRPLGRHEVVATVAALLLAAACSSSSGAPPSDGGAGSDGGGAGGGLAFSLGSAGQEYGKAIAVDGDDNVIVAALFENTVDADPGPGTTTVTSAGRVDILLAKYDAGGVLLWARRIGGSGIDVPHGVAVDPVGNVYVAGYFGLDGQAGITADFDPSANVATLATLGGYDAFLARFDAAGSYQWALRLGSSAGDTEERAWDLAVDGAGNAWVCGAFSGTMEVDPRGTSGRSLTATGGGVNLFLARYAPDGSNTFAVGVAAGLADVFSEGYCAADVDPIGRAFLAGNFRGSVDLDPGPGTSSHTAAGATDVFLARYDGAGGLEWGIGIGGTDRDILSPGAMRLGRDGHLYLTGHFRGTIDFDPTAGVRSATNQGPADDTFVASYSAGGALRWGFGIGSAAGLDGGHRVAFDSQNHVLVAGWFRGTADFDPGPEVRSLTARGTADAADVFLAKYDNQGAHQWARSFGAPVQGAERLSIAAGLAVDSADNAWITGQYYGAADFDPSSEALTLTSAGENDAFVAKYDPLGRLWRP